MDTNPLERERGITILAKNASVTYQGVKINIIDTPGHADFSGEVERVMNMADGCLLLVDAVDGPMPQTTYVLRQALEQNVVPMVVINKIDRPDARVGEVVELVQDLFLELATDADQLDFPVIYTSAREGYATLDPDRPGTDMKSLFDAILDSVPSPTGDPDAPAQMLVAALDYDNYLGQVAIGRITNGTLQLRDNVALLHREEEPVGYSLERVFVFHGMERVEDDRGVCGRHRGSHWPGGGIDWGYHCQRGGPAGSADDRHPGAYGADDLWREHLAVRRAGGQSLHVEESVRPFDARAAHQCQPAS